MSSYEEEGLEWNTFLFSGFNAEKELLYDGKFTKLSKFLNDNYMSCCYGLIQSNINYTYNHPSLNLYS